MAKSPLPAANADRWTICAGSVQAESAKPPILGQRNEAREEGKACKEIAMQILRSYQEPVAKILTPLDFIDTLSDNGVLITISLMDCVMEFVNDVIDYANTHGCLQDLKIEERVDLGYIYPGMYGFCDVYHYDPDMLMLTVWEAKFGRHAIEAFENPQAVEWITGVATENCIQTDVLNMLAIEFRLIQPRAWHSEGTIRKWLCDYEEVLPVLDRLHRKAIESQSSDPSCVPGPHCSGCNARHRCGALTKAGHIAMHLAMGIEDATLEGAELGFELTTLNHMMKVIKARITGLEEQVKATIQSGEDNVPGWDMARSQKRQRWKPGVKPQQIVEEAELLYDFDLRKPDFNATPKQAITRGLDPDFVEQYSETPLGELKLVPDDGSKARQAFRRRK